MSLSKPVAPAAAVRAAEQAVREKHLSPFHLMLEPLSANARFVAEKRYLAPGEAWEGLVKRVAESLAEVDGRLYGAKPEEVLAHEAQFFGVMAERKFLPAGRTLANAGRADRRLISNCIVLHIPDSIEGIFDTLKDAAVLQKHGSGLGFPLHTLRPAGWKAIGAEGVASGPVSFLHVYNEAFGVIKQQNRHGPSVPSGSLRLLSDLAASAGANMAIMSIEHPDILEFLHCKDREGDLRNFNVSVGLTDRFMKAVDARDATPWECEWAGQRMLPRRIKRRPGSLIFESAEEVRLTASQLMREIVESAWKTGEPGVVMLDAVNRDNPLPGLGRIECSNPCFRGDVLVATVDGPRRIADISEPTCVYSYDLASRTFVVRQASAAWVTHRAAAVVRVSLEDGASIVVTPDHRLLTAEGQFVAAADLEPGRLVSKLEQAYGLRELHVAVESVEHLAEPADVYDMTVDGTHCLIADGIVAHNCGEQERDLLSVFR